MILEAPTFYIKISTIGISGTYYCTSHTICAWGESGNGAREFGWVFLCDMAKTMDILEGNAPKNVLRELCTSAKINYCFKDLNIHLNVLENILNLAYFSRWKNAWNIVVTEYDANQDTTDLYYDIHGTVLTIKYNVMELYSEEKVVLSTYFELLHEWECHSVSY